MKQIMIAAAGTGGHVFPALAVATELQQQGWSVAWLGTTEGRLENKVVPAAGIPLHPLPVQGLRGHGLFRKVLAPWRLSRAVWQCVQLMRAQQTQVVLTFGGYVSGPAGVAAKLLGIPLLVHEQNAVPGLTTKLLSRFAQEVLLGFAPAQRYLPNAKVVGNPLRAGVLAAQGKHLEATSAAKPLTLLIVGGSLGAEALNQAVPKALAQIQLQDLVVQHQSGSGRTKMVLSRYADAFNTLTPTAEKTPPQLEVIEFIEQMEQAYAAADLVICRAGALTVAEIAAVGVAALFVPLPHAVDDHQTANAQALVDQGAARLIPQARLEQDLVKELQALLQQPAQLRTMAQAARKAATRDATEQVVAACERWVKDTAETVSEKSKPS